MFVPVEASAPLVEPIEQVVESHWYVPSLPHVQHDPVEESAELCVPPPMPPIVGALVPEPALVRPPPPQDEPATHDAPWAHVDVEPPDEQAPH